MTDDKVMAVKVDMIRHLFDLAVGSTDFGSGWLDTDDVNLLRETAELLGVDPDVATPGNFKGQYPHEFKPVRPSRWQIATNPDIPNPCCDHCNGSAESFVHNVNWTAP